MNGKPKFSTKYWDLFKSVIALILLASMIGLSVDVNSLLRAWLAR